MSGQLSLILNDKPIPRGEIEEHEHASPHYALVCQSERGHWEWEKERPRFWAQKLLARNRPCFAVDMGDHRRTGELTRTPLPCVDQAHRFEASVDVGFRVHDPEEVVRRNVRDAPRVVYAHLVQRLRDHSRRFAIDQADRAEAIMNQSLTGCLVLDCGITVFHCSVRLEPDAAAREYIQQLTRDRRETTTGGNAHLAELRGVEHTEAIESARQLARLARERRETEALQELPVTVHDLLRRHLATHPNDTAEVTRMLLEYERSVTAHRDVREQRQTELLQFLVEKDIIRAGDLDKVRDSLVGGMEPGAGGAPRPELAPSTAAPVLWGHAGDDAEDTAPTAHGIIPVYVVVDTSQSAAGCLEELNEGLRSLHTLLSHSPDVTRAVRLSVLAFADTARVCLSLCQVGWGTNVPTLTAGGRASFAPAFRLLGEQLPADVDRLKATVSTVHRPVVFFATPGLPEDEWTEARGELLARRYRPTVIACALEQAGAAVAARVATHPRLAFGPTPGAGQQTTAGRFAVLLQEKVLHLGRGVIAGNPDLEVNCPQGLCPAGAAGPAG